MLTLKGFHGRLVDVAAVTVVCTVEAHVSIMRFAGARPNRHWEINVTLVDGSKWLVDELGDDELMKSTINHIETAVGAEFHKIVHDECTYFIRITDLVGCLVESHGDIRCLFQRNAALSNIQISCLLGTAYGLHEKVAKLCGQSGH